MYFDVKGIDKNSYLDPSVHYDEGDSPDDRLKRHLLNKENREAREVMSQNIKDLIVDLQEATDNPHPEISFDIQLINVVETIAICSANQIPLEDKKRSTLRFISKLRQEGNLLYHLREAGDSFYEFFQKVNKGKAETEQILKPRHATLLEFVGRTHDICKLLGSANAQIDPDHEVIYKNIVGKFLVGKTFTPTSGETITFTEADVKFITEVVGLHEDIWRESSFANQANSLKKDTQEEDIDYVRRARSLMHFIDIFGSAVRFDGETLKIVNEEAFKSRFIDLFQRHIRLSIGIVNSNSDKELVDWTIGKVYRPKWGLHGVAGLTWVFESLKEWDVQVDDELIKSVQSGISEVLFNASASIVDALTNQKKYKVIVPDGETTSSAVASLVQRQAEIKSIQVALAEEQNQKI